MHRREWPRVQLHTEAQCRGAPACLCGPSILGRGAAMHNPMRSCGSVIACLLFSFMLSLAPTLPARAAINANNLGAKYDATQSNINCRVYSSRATRIEVWLYKT